MFSTTDSTYPLHSHEPLGFSDKTSGGELATTVSRNPDQRLSRHQRLTRSSQFQDTYSQGRRWIGKFMVLWLREDREASLRLGVVASRKVGGAIARNRAKRRLREGYRRNRHRLAGSYDVVLVARRAIRSASWDELVEEMMSLAAKAGLAK